MASLAVKAKRAKISPIWISILYLIQLLHRNSAVKIKI